MRKVITRSVYFDVPQIGGDLLTAWEKATDSYMEKWYLLNGKFKMSDQDRRKYIKEMEQASQTAQILEGLLHVPIIKTT